MQTPEQWAEFAEREISALHTSLRLAGAWGMLRSMLHSVHPDSDCTIEDVRAAFIAADKVMDQDRISKVYH
jgi:hypothetical protein